MKQVEYLVNCRKSRLLVQFTQLRYKRLSWKLGYTIPINVFGPRLSIAHGDAIVVNSTARIGGELPPACMCEYRHASWARHRCPADWRQPFHRPWCEDLRPDYAGRQRSHRSQRGREHGFPGRQRHTGRRACQKGLQQDIPIAADRPTKICAATIRCTVTRNPRCNESGNQRLTSTVRLTRVAQNIPGRAEYA